MVKLLPNNVQVNTFVTFWEARWNHETCTWFLPTLSMCVQRETAYIRGHCTYMCTSYFADKANISTYDLISLLCIPYALGCFLFEWRVIHLRECCSGVYSDEHLNDTRLRPWFAAAYLYNEPLYRDQSTRHNLVCLTHCDQRAFSNSFSTFPEWSYAVWFESQWSWFLRAQLTMNKQWYISWYVFERAAAGKPLHNVWFPRLISRFLFSISNATLRQ